MTDREDAPEEPGFGLIMPFVSVASVGGPFDDMAFVCGFDCGRLDAELETCQQFGAVPRARLVKAPILEQLDLIAMRRGYTVTVGEKDETGEWVHVEFGRSESLRDH